MQKCPFRTIVAYLHASGICSSFWTHTMNLGQENTIVAKSTSVFLKRECYEIICCDESETWKNSKKMVILLVKGVLSWFLWTFFNTASSVAPQISLCWRMLRSKPVLLRLLHWQPDGLTPRLDIIHSPMVEDFEEIFQSCFNIPEGKSSPKHLQILEK